MTTHLYPNQKRGPRKTKTVSLRGTEKARDRIKAKAAEYGMSCVDVLDKLLGLDVDRSIKKGEKK